MTRAESWRSASVGQGCVPAGKFAADPEISVQKMSSRSEYPRHFGKEAGQPRVCVRGLDIEHRVEGFVREGQVLGVAVHEIQPGHVVPLLAVGDPVRVVVQAGIGGGLQRVGSGTRLRHRGRN